MAGTAVAQVRPELKNLWENTYVLYADDFPKCTTVPFRATGSITYFFTAAHCLRDVGVLAIGELGGATRTAQIIIQSESMDLGIVAVEGRIATIPLGEDPQVGDLFVQVFFPYMAGKFIDSGIVASESIHTVPWEKVMLGYAMTVPGGSGAAIYCTEQAAVCGIEVGSLREIPSALVFVPVSMLKRLLQWE